MKVVRRYHNRRYGRVCFYVLEKNSKNMVRTVNTTAIKRDIYSSGISFFSLYPERKLHAGLKEIKNNCSEEYLQLFFYCPGNL